MSDSPEPRVRKESKAQRIERIKSAKDGLDVWDDILRYSKLGFDAIDPEDCELFKWYGIYQQQPKAGHFMMRLRLPNGILQAHQLERVAELTDQYARGYGDVTTRQNIQLHWLTIDDIPYVMSQLAAVGVITIGACGDNPRNVVGCPVAGVDRHELCDARGVVDEVHKLFLGNRAYSNLPRKFKTSIAGCGVRCPQPEINDLGFSAVVRPRRNGADELGYDLMVGGGLSTEPMMATLLPLFIRPEQVRPVSAAVAALFCEHGNRDKRTKARLKFLVAEWGVERVVEEIQARVPFTLDRDPAPLPELPDERDHLGIHPQRQDGFHYLGLATRLGRITAAQMREVAALAREHGDGTVRLTNNQNLILTGVPTARVDEVARRASNALLPADASVWQRNFIACTGTQFCNLALTETKNAPGEDSPAERALQHLEQKLGHFKHFVRINYNGCPNSCGQHWVADVGLQGVLMKGDGGQQIEGALITIGGGLGRDSSFGHGIGVRLALKDVPDALVRVFSAYESEATADENFRGWCQRVGDEAVGRHLTGGAL